MDLLIVQNSFSFEQTYYACPENLVSDLFQGGCNPMIKVLDIELEGPRFNPSTGCAPCVPGEDTLPALPFLTQV